MSITELAASIPTVHDFVLYQAKAEAKVVNWICHVLSKVKMKVSNCNANNTSDQCSFR